MTNQTITHTGARFLPSESQQGHNCCPPIEIFGNTFSKHDTFNHGLSTYPPPNTPPLPEIDSLMISAFENHWFPSMLGRLLKPIFLGRVHFGEGPRLSGHKLWRSICIDLQSFNDWIHLRKFKPVKPTQVQNLSGMIFLWTNSESQKENPNIFPGDVLAFNFFVNAGVVHSCNKFFSTHNASVAGFKCSLLLGKTPYKVLGWSSFGTLAKLRALKKAVRAVTKKPYS